MALAVQYAGSPKRGHVIRDTSKQMVQIIQQVSLHISFAADDGEWQLSGEWRVSFPFLSGDEEREKTAIF